MTYDVIVVGARCAGASTSLLLARAGLRVLMIDRADFPSDTVSGHMIKLAGVERLQRWGLLDAVLASGCPRPEGRTVSFGAQRLHVPAEPGALTPMAPRRIVLDDILIRAAAAAGADVRLHTSLIGLVSDGQRVNGVRTRDRAGRTALERSRLVIGADGRTSRLARLVGATRYQDTPTVSIAYYAYWEGVAASSVALSLRPGVVAGMAPTHFGQTMVFVQLPIARRMTFVRDIEANYLAALRSVPDIAALVDSGQRTTRVIGMTELPNFFRTPFGPGWALVGDAGHHKDPLVARGISDAFRDAELLTDAILADRSGVLPLPAALRRYQQFRDSASTKVAELNVRLATLDAPIEEAECTFQALVAAEQEADRLCFSGARIRTG
jgi:flavin-dependent dehydrogenase